MKNARIYAIVFIMQKQNSRDPILVKLIRFGIYLTAFIPLIIFRDFISPFHFGKVIVFRTLVEVLGIGYLILVLRDRFYLPKRDNIFWALFLFVLAFSLTTLTSVLKYPSFWGSLERMGGLWTFWHYFVFYIILTSVFTKREHWQRLIDLTIFVGVLSAFYGFFQKTNIQFFLGSGNRTRIFGTIGNAALFSGYQLFTVFLSLTMYWNPKNLQNRKLFYLFAFIATSIAVMMTVVRGSVMGYVVGLTVFMFLWMKHKKSYVGKIIFNSLLGAIVLFIVFALVFGDSAFVKNSRYLGRLTDISLNSPTTRTRFWAWEAGLKGWNDSPKTMILGWGPENFNIPFSNNFNPKFFAGPGAETLFDRAHNMFIEILVTMGLVGLLAYFGIFYSLFACLRRLRHNSEFSIYGIGLTSGLIAYIIHNSFIFDTSANFIVFFTVAGYISHLTFRDREGGGVSSGPVIKNRHIINSILAISVVFVAVLIYKTNILPSKANYALTRAIVRGWANDFDGALAKYKESLSYDVPGKYEYRHRFAQYLVGTGGPSVKEEKIREAYKFAITEINKNIKENDIDYLPYLYGSRLNIILGKDNSKSPYNDTALEYSMKALELSPTFVRTYFEIAQAYLNKKDYPKAIEFFQKAVDLNPDTGISHGYLGAAKIESGDLSGAEDLQRAIENNYAPRDEDFARLVNAYIKIGDISRIAWIYELMIQVNPKNPQHYASLAMAYVKLGRIDEAVAMAYKAVQVDPSFEPDARAFIKSLGREY